MLLLYYVLSAPITTHVSWYKVCKDDLLSKRLVQYWLIGWLIVALTTNLATATYVLWTVSQIDLLHRWYTQGYTYNIKILHKYSTSVGCAYVVPVCICAYVAVVGCTYCVLVLRKCMYVYIARIAIHISTGILLQKDVLSISICTDNHTEYVEYCCFCSLRMYLRILQCFRYS